MKVKELEIHERPRERLIEKGANALSNVELLAILLGSGTSREDVVQLSERICRKYSFSKLKELSYEELIQIDGIKMAKATQLLACFEIVKRAMNKELYRVEFQHPSKIFEYVYSDIMLLEEEVLIVLYVGCKLQILKKSIFSSFSGFLVEFPTKKIISEALSCHAYGIIFVHNHPSGEVLPSKEDIEVTLNFKRVLSYLQIILLDHFVVSTTNYYSFLGHGLFTRDEEYNFLGDWDENRN